MAQEQARFTAQAWAESALDSSHRGAVEKVTSQKMASMGERFRTLQLRRDAHLDTVGEKLYLFALTRLGPEDTSGPGKATAVQEKLVQLRDERSKTRAATSDESSGGIPSFDQESN